MNETIDIQDKTLNIPNLDSARELAKLYSESPKSIQKNFENEINALFSNGQNINQKTTSEIMDYEVGVFTLLNEIRISIQNNSPTRTPANNGGLGLTTTLQSIISAVESHPEKGTGRVQQALNRLKAIQNSLGKIDENTKKSILSPLNDLLSELQQSGSGDLLSRQVHEIYALYELKLSEGRKIVEKTQKANLREIIKEVSGIEIYGDASTEELETEIRNFRTKLMRGELGKGLLDAERDIIIEQLNQILEGKEAAEEIGYSFIEDYFDGIAQSIQPIGDKFVLDLGDGNQKTFSTQNEAKDFVLKLKQTAESHFQSDIRNILEPTIIALGEGIYALEKSLWVDSPLGPISPYELGGYTLSNMGELRENWDWTQAFGTLILALATITSTSVVAGAHSGVFESAKRRIIHDWFNGKITGKNMMTDYARGHMAPPVDMSSPEGKDYMENKQRQQIMDLLWADLEKKYTPGTKEYDRYKKQIAKIENFKLIRGPTFYYLSYKYGKLQGLPSRFLHTLWSGFGRGATIYFPVIRNGQKSLNPLKYLGIWSSTPIDDSVKLANRVVGHLLDQGEIQEGIDLFYQDKKITPEFSNNEPPKLNVEGSDKKNDRFQRIINEINSRNISSKEKERLVKKFTEYVDGLVNSPKSKAVIEKEIYFLLNTEFEQRATLLEEIDKKLSQIRAKNTMWDGVKTRIRLTEEYRIKRFRDIIQRREWVGTMEEFKTELDQIKNQPRYRAKANYGAKVGTPDFSQELSNMTIKGKEVGAERELILREFFTMDRIGNDYESSERARTKLMTSILEYIDFGIHNNDLEKFARTEIAELFDKVISGSLAFSREFELYQEINQIMKGFLPSYKLVDRLEEIAKTQQGTPHEHNIKDLLAKAKEKKLDMTMDDLVRLQRDPSGFDYTIDRLRIPELLAKTNLEKRIKVTEGWSDADFNRSLEAEASMRENPTSNEYFKALKDKYKGPLDSLLILDVLDDSNRRSAILKELNIFSHALANNKYSEGQADDILRRIFSGELFDSIPHSDKKSAADFYDGHAEFVREIEQKWALLGDDTREDKARKIISNPNIEEDKIGIIEIKETISRVQTAKEVEELKNRNVATIEGLIEELKRARSPAGLDDISKELRALISDSSNNINRLEEPYKTLLRDFDSVRENMNNSFGGVPSPRADDSPESSRKTGADLLIGDTQFEDQKSQLSKKGVDTELYFRDILKAHYNSLDEARNAVNAKLIIDGHLVRGVDGSFDWPEEKGDVSTEDIDRTHSRKRGVNIYFTGENLRNDSYGRALEAASIMSGISLDNLSKQIKPEDTPAIAKDRINTYMKKQGIDYQMKTKIESDELIDIQKLVLSDRIIRVLTVNGIKINDGNISAIESYITSLSNPSSSNYNSVNESIKQVFGFEVDINSAPNWGDIPKITSKIPENILLELQSIRNHAHIESGKSSWRSFFSALKKAST